MDVSTDWNGYGEKRCVFKQVLCMKLVFEEWDEMMQTGGVYCDLSTFFIKICFIICSVQLIPNEIVKCY